MQPTTTARHWGRIFFPIWIGQALSLLGSQIAQFGVVWWLTTTTGSGTVLAGATLVAILPGVVLGPLVGALVDRWDRKRVMIVADAVSALAAALLALLFWSGMVQLWHIYAIMFVRSVAGTFHFPAMQASTSLMVPHEQLARVSGLNQMLQGAMNIAAPPLGALLLALLPLSGLLAIDVVTAALAIVPMAFVAIPRPPRAESGAPTSVLQDVRAGLDYVRAWPGLLVVLVMSMVINFLIAPAFALLPLLVTRHFGGGALQLATIEASWWLGILLGGLVLSAWGGFRSRIRTALLALIAMGFATLAPGFAPPWLFWGAVAGLLIAGAFNSLCNGPLFAMMQSVVAPDMQGRVFTLIGSAGSLMMPLGLAVAGPLSDIFGPQIWFAVGGVACVLMGMYGLLSPAVMGIERHGEVLAAEPSATA
jgi:MFS transporter, DHA3 family, macrolide efflux protein